MGCILFVFGFEVQYSTCSRVQESGRVQELFRLNGLGDCLCVSFFSMAVWRCTVSAEVQWLSSCVCEGGGQRATSLLGVCPLSFSGTSLSRRKIWRIALVVFRIASVGCSFIGVTQMWGESKE